MAEVSDPTANVLRNFKCMCRLLNEDINQEILSQLSISDEDAKKGKGVSEIVVEADLTPGNARALAAALLAPPGMSKMLGDVYTALKTLKIWRSNLGASGVSAIAELLRLGGADLQLALLELVDAGVEIDGAVALGRSLATGMNVSLRILRLDYNPGIGSEGIAALSRGLRTNRSLEELHACFCSLGPEAGVFLADILEFSQSSLRVLNVQGNRLEGVGLNDVAHGLMENSALLELNVADNAIGNSELDVVALRVLAQVISSGNPISALTSVDLQHNRIGFEGGSVLVPCLQANNKRIKTFLVDFSIPAEIFTALHRTGDKSGKKKKGKKKKK
uniref:Uncharacterized protein n=1 Tax=Pinguiococcus pyrenoidosus TaxID=172671 RepID=A0A7R9U7G5_9STRA